MRVGAFERDLVDPTRRQGREDMLVLPPLVAERRLPFDIGRDAVAVADVYGGLADDAVNAFEKAMHEMLPRLLAVADDVEAAIFLDLQREQGRVALALGERVAVEPPRRPQFARLGQPGRFWQTAGDRRFEHSMFSHIVIARSAATRQSPSWRALRREIASLRSQ